VKQSIPAESKVAVKGRGWSKPFRWAYNLLFHEDVYHRIGGFLLWGFVFLAASWAVGFLLVKTPFLKGTLMVDKLFGITGIREVFGEWGIKWLGADFTVFKKTLQTADFFNTWGNVLLITLKTFAHHMVIVLVFILLMNLLQIKRVPLGYIFFLLYTVLLGLVVGTNAYTFPPQWSKQIGAVVTFARFGLWQWFAYGLLAVSTLKWGWFSSASALKPGWKKLRSFWPIRFGSGDNVEVFVYGLLFVLAASFAEARLIVHYGYHFIF
jgi:hypothetical protein